jgi:predicted ABC-type ATPase
MREIIIIAGPNGAGKTSFANRFLPSADSELAFVNADEIARSLAKQPIPQSQRDLRATTGHAVRTIGLSTDFTCARSDT